MAEPYKVMLIDDDCGVHTLIKRILEDAGYSYCGAYGGEEGLEMLSARHPDLLLLDVMMPGMNGFDVCKSIRERDAEFPSCSFPQKATSSTSRLASKPAATITW